MSWKAILLLIAILLLVLIVIFFAIVIGLVVLAYIFRKRWQTMLQNIVLPDPRAVEEQFEEYRAASQTENVDEIVKIIINKHANKAGLIGAVTGVGGVFLNVVGLPVDAVSVLRVQASMIFLIAFARGHRHDLSEEDKLKMVLVLSGSNQIVRYVARYLVKIVLTSVPGAGAVAGYILNYAAVKGTGEVANKYFSGKLTREELKQVSALVFGKAKSLTAQAASSSVNMASAASSKVKGLVHRSPPRLVAPPVAALAPEEAGNKENQELSS